MLTPLWAREVVVDVNPPVDIVLDPGVAPPKPPQAPTGVTISLQSSVPGNLFLRNAPIILTAKIVNHGPEQMAKINMRLATGFGALVFADDVREKLPAKGEFEQRIAFPGADRLPNGAYRLDVWVEGERDPASASTLLSVWNGPAEQQSDLFGISYAGALTAERTWKDLDLFKQMGAGWLRFPLQGWLPQGQADPAEAAPYDRFAQEATARGFNLLAAFTPMTTIDPSLNPEQADKEYADSLLAATGRFGGTITQWELMHVKPDPAYPDLKGFRVPQLVKGRQALREANKALNVLFPLEDSFRYNALELFANAAPAATDAMGMHYDFVGIPEADKANPRPPIFDIEEMQAKGKAMLKRTPVLWSAEYGFDSGKVKRLYDTLYPAAPLYQAALISRAVILDRAMGVTRTFWRHLPGSEYDLPFVDGDGNASPSLLAMRTTLQALEGVTSVSEMTEFDGQRVFLLQYGGKKEKRDKKKGGKTRYALAVWSQSGAAGLSIKSSATQLDVTDLWGNVIELHPVNGTAVFTVDEFPRFIELGGTAEVEQFHPFATFRTSPLILREGGENALFLELVNDQRQFTGKITCDLNFRRWPGNDEVKSDKVTLDPYGRATIPFRLKVPEGARRGQVYEINVDIMIGSRRVGFLELPVWYRPEG